MELAEAVEAACKQPSSFRFLYNDSLSLKVPLAYYAAALGESSIEIGTPAEFWSLTSVVAVAKLVCQQSFNDPQETVWDLVIRSCMATHPPLMLQALGMQ